MSVDRTLERIEELLACACGDITEAVSLHSSLTGQDQAKFKRQLADSLVRVWDARDVVFNLRPDLKPSFASQDPGADGTS
jgi:hypothetical protein